MPEIPSHITGNVWKIECAVGDEVGVGDTIVILESMKMEIPVESEIAGTVVSVLCEEGESVAEGTPLIVVDEAD